MQKRIRKSFLLTSKNTFLSSVLLSAPAFAFHDIWSKGTGEQVENLFIHGPTVSKNRIAQWLGAGVLLRKFPLCRCSFWPRRACTTRSPGRMLDQHELLHATKTVHARRQNHFHLRPLRALYIQLYTSLIQLIDVRTPRQYVRPVSSRIIPANSKQVVYLCT